jgi:5-methyltetrahydropteroyltriglutamate--homocysteine methyltransferase
MKRTKPPFRADHVGSFLRPAALKEARAKREKGAITAAGLKAVEDREIEKIIKKQEELGLQLATDGEFRRSWWHFDFLGMLDGVQIHEAAQGIQFRGVQTKAQELRVVGKVGFSNHPMLEHFKFLKAHTKVTPKMTIPAPPVLHFRLPKDGINKSVYPDLDQFFQDVGNAYKKAVKAFYDAGCRYLQFDDTVWAYLCSQEELRKARERMSNVDQLQGIYARVINTALELLGKVNYDGYFLEYDTERAGGFEPLRFLPKGNKVVVLGLVTSKSGALEKKDDVKRRIEEAGKFAPIEQFCLSPQCGFASTEEGNILAEEEQWAKLRMIANVADEVWGR